MSESKIEYTFTATDDLTPTMHAILGALLQLSKQTKDLETTLGEFGKLITEAATNAGKGVEATKALSDAYLALATSINDQTTAYTKAQAAALEYRKEQAALREATRAAAEEAKAGQAIWSQMFAVAGGVGIATSISQIVTGLKEFVMSVIEVGTQLQSLRASFVGVAGSVRGGAADFAFITRESNRLGLDLLTTALQFRTFEAAAHGTALEGMAGQVAFSAFAQRARELGIEGGQLTRVFQALDHMMETQIVNTRELRQLAQALPGTYQALATGLGITTEELKKTTTAGKLLAEDVIPALVRGFKALGEGAKVNIGDLPSTTFAQLKNELVLFKEELSKGLLPPVQDIAGWFAKVLKAAREAREQFTREMQGPAPVLTGGAEVSPELQRRNREITLAESELEDLLFKKNPGTLYRILNPFEVPPTEEQITAAKKRLADLYAAQEKGITEWRRLMEAESTGPLSEDRGGKAVTAVLRILKEGQEKLRQIDVAAELEPGIDRAQEKVKSWLSTIKEANAVLTRLPGVVLKSITPELRAGEQALRLTGGVQTSAPGDYPYKDLIEKISATRNVDPALIKTLIGIESNFDPTARNQTPGSTAKGLGQFTNPTWRDYGQGKDVFDPEANITATVNYVADLLNKFGGSLERALHAYGDSDKMVLAQYKGTGYASGAVAGPAASGSPLAGANALYVELQAVVQQEKDIKTAQLEAARRAAAAPGQAGQADVLLGRLAAFTDKPDQSAAEQAKQKVIQAGIELRAAAERELKKFAESPELRDFAPNTAEKIAARLAVLEGAVTANAQDAFDKVTKKTDEQIQKIRGEIGLGGLSPIDAEIQKIMNHYADLTRQLKTLKGTVGDALDPTSTRQANTITGLLMLELPKQQQAAIDEATTKETDKVKQNIDDIRLKIEGEGSDARGRELASIEKWGVDMKAAVTKLQREHTPEELGKLGAGYKAEDLQKMYDAIPAAMAEKTLETSPMFKSIAKGMQSAIDSVKSQFSTLWSDIMSGGIKTWNDLGASMIKLLRDAMTKVSGEIISALVDAVTKGSTASGGGAASAAAKWIMTALGLASSAATGTAPISGGDVGAPTGVARGGVLPALGPIHAFAHGGILTGLGDFHPLRLAGGGIVREPSWAMIGEDRGHHEAVIPMKDNRYIPVEMTGKGAGQEAAPIVINLDARPHNVLNPSDFRTSAAEIINVVTQNITQDGVVRKVIVRHTR